MKKIVMTMALAVAAMVATAGASVRFEAPGTARPIVATGVERRGELGGGRGATRPTEGFLL